MTISKEEGRSRPSWVFWVKLLSYLGGGAAAGYFGQPLIAGNEQAAQTIVTLFSILAGFLVAIVGFVGDPAMLARGSWRHAEMDIDRMRDILFRHCLLFWLYLLTLAVVFGSQVASLSPDTRVWFERLYLGLAAAAFCRSLRLPWQLMKAQLDRLDSEIDKRRSDDGLDP